MKTVFLFGSGADSDCCDKLKSGQEFAKALLLQTYCQEVASLLGQDFKKFQLIYPTSTKVFVQTVATFSNEAKKYLPETDVNNCCSYFNDKKVIDYEKVIRPLGTKWYQILHSTDSKDNNIKKFFLNYAVFFDSLDEKFNSLRYQDYNDSAKRVINAYTTIFVLMIKSLYNIDSSFNWRFADVFNKLAQPYDITCSTDSYYRLLRSSTIDYSVATTNYTSLAEQETGQDTVYLHGKLTWFEDLNNQSIYDCTDSSDKNHLLSIATTNKVLPFILIPSGVKPLICTRQIKQFSAFIDRLESSNELCVIGYKFNSEDNHINSIIAEWLQKPDNKLVYFNYENQIDFSNFLWANNFNVEQYDDGSMTKYLSLGTEKIISIKIDKTNSHDVFKHYLEQKERRS